MKLQPIPRRLMAVFLLFAILATVLTGCGMASWRSGKDRETSDATIEFDLSEVVDSFFDTTDDDRGSFDRDESKAYFNDMSEMPELNEERVTAAVQQVYYTNGGYLAVKMVLANGADKLKHINSMYVEIRNGNNAVIGSGSTDQIADTYYIDAGGYNDYVFYISPEYVQIKDDPLTTIYHSITIDGYTYVSPFGRDESKPYFTNMSDLPEPNEERVTAAVQQVYYTNGGHLAVEMVLANGRKTVRNVHSMHVVIRNGNNAVIGSGYSDQLAETLSIPAGGYTDYCFFISPEYVQITDDPLTTINYSINIVSDTAP